jgi:Putative peptidoglycan binding domain
VGAAVGAIALVAVAVGAIVSAELPSSSQGAGRVASSSGAATVQRRNLVATDTESGTLGYVDPQTVFNRLSGTITSLSAVGHVVRPGQTLYRVDGAPVVLLDGTVPAYRNLSDGVSAGADVTQLKRNLVQLGFDPTHQITINSTFDAATTAAVERWQASLGETQTGTVTLGTMVFLPGAQRITSVSAVLGSNGGSSSAASGAGAASGASTAVVAPRPEFVVLSTATPDATTTAQTTSTSTTPTTPGATTPGSTHSGSGSGSGSGAGTGTGTGPGTNGKPSGQMPSAEAALLALLKAETLELKKELAGSGGSSSRSSSGSSGGSGASGGGARSGSARSGGSSGGSGGGSAATSAGGTSGASASASGSGGGTAQQIMQTTANKLVVTVDLDATKQSEASVGEPVSVQLPTGNTVGGRITAVSSVAQSTTSSSASSSAAGSGSGSSGSSTAPSATIPVTIDVTGHHQLAGLDQAAVSVNFQQQVERDVLSVPVSALLASAGGNYAVQEVAPPHRLIAVTPGLFAAGFVQISGTQIVPGLQVTDSQG